MFDTQVPNVQKGITAGQIQEASGPGHPALDASDGFVSRKS